MKKKKILIVCLVIVLLTISSIITYSIYRQNLKDKEEQKRQEVLKEKRKKAAEKKKDEELKKQEEEKKKVDEENKEKENAIKSNKAIDDYPPLNETDGEKEVIGTSDKGYTIYKRNGITYIDGIMIVNKSYGLPEDYYPKNAHADAANKTNTCNSCINEVAYNAFNDMKRDASAIGLNIYIQSGYRPYSSQKTIYNRYVARDGKNAADTYSARPGHSEHQSGLCFDLNSISDSFANTNEGKWVNENAYLYGFIIRFPKGKQNYTGYKYESWHLRYVGKELATKLYNNGDWLSLEEYFGISSEYED
ncbi:MAG: D-alanyl-D-alanine carboxypeptidase family protein [Firmicutes bacterium]|nr:D-alanyl-D-alanine carboxypeptidase family protein [Bacillota bacterium]